MLSAHNALGQNALETKCSWDKMLKAQNALGQNAKCSWDKMLLGQNALCQNALGNLFLDFFEPFALVLT
jgi:hypothetical protein